MHSFISFLFSSWNVCTTDLPSFPTRRSSDLNITLPVLIAMKDKKFHALLRKTFSNPDSIAPNDFNHLVESLKNTNAIEASYKVSNRYLDKALLELGTFPDHKAKVTLENIAKYIGKRRS